MSAWAIDPSVTNAAIVTAGSVVGSILLWRGAKFTADRSTEASRQATTVDAQEAAVNAWKELLEPYREEVARMRSELADVREELAGERTDRAAAQRVTDGEVERLQERVGLLTVQLSEWKQMARVISRWATRLRDEVLRLGGTVPATPDELLVLQAIDDAEA